MSWLEWFIVYFILHSIHALGTWKLYKAAGQPVWTAFVPVYNMVVMMKIINRPWWLTILLFLPVVQLIMIVVLWVEMCRAFGFNKLKDTVLVILTAGLYLYFINYTQPLHHVKDRSLSPQSTSGEWTSSILFAIIAATIVHTYVMQPFIIPSPSLEKTLMTGDFLFVSKFHYGARLPMTPIAAPMVHDTIPLIGIKSYTPKPQIPYTRIPGFQKIKNNDIVVFNYPTDTTNTYPYDDGNYYYKPIDKKSNYVKRCVGIAGDTLSMVAGKVYINGEPLILPDRARLQHSYDVLTNGQALNSELLRDNYGISETPIAYPRNPSAYLIPAATDEAYEKLKNVSFIEDSAKRTMETGVWDRSKFPYNSQTLNNNDNLAPFYIPERGVTTAITSKNIDYYKRIIEVYEGSEMGINNVLDISNSKVLLNGRALTQYTFKQSYYWLMGDNRHNSLDSRAWGFVPFNHVVGKPVFVWMSYDPSKSFPSGVRTERIFTTVHGDGQPSSYLWYFLILVAAYFGFKKFYWDKRKKKSD